jgi:uncharacterized damage-inducible protein DinB
MLDELVEAWRINNRVNLRLLEAIGEDALLDTLSRRGGRNVAREFAHVQFVRAFQLRKRAKSLASGVRVFAPASSPGRGALKAALEDSALRIERWIRLAAEGAPGVRTIKRGLVPLVAYLISHESHHRGRILLTLKVCGHPVPPAIRNGIWDWDRI